jgi:hypothetical protein
MAILKKGIISVPKGKLSNIVGYRRNGSDIISGVKMRNPSDINSSLVNQASKLQVLSQMYKIYSKGFERILNQMNQSQYNTWEHFSKINLSRDFTLNPYVLDNIALGSDSTPVPSVMQGSWDSANQRGSVSFVNTFPFKVLDPSGIAAFMSYKRSSNSLGVGVLGGSNNLKTTGINNSNLVVGDYQMRGVLYRDSNIQYITKIVLIGSIIV